MLIASLMTKLGARSQRTKDEWRLPLIASDEL
jgi:hypothetical protein